MVQLRVETGQEYVFIDLYETEPIKLTLSIEDITNTEARSVFSRTFRVPSTGNNNKFFKHAFMIEGVDFDVTVRQPATILIDGAEFKSGHVRLQKIYRNKSKDSIEYEIVFMGETRDFATALSDKKLRDLDLSAYDHSINYANIVASWQAYPEGGLTDGLFNGDILYPLVDFGEAEDEPRIAYTGNTAAGGFNHQQNSLIAGRFRPMIRAKALWDKIFEEAGFTYTSNIANDPSFTQLYVTAWGNDPDNPVAVDGSANHMNVTLSDDYYISGVDTILWDVENLDPNDNYDPTTGIYTVPQTTVLTNYQVNVRIDGNTRAEAGGGVIDVRLKRNGATIDFDQFTIPANTQRRWLSIIQANVPLTAGDEIYVEVEESGDVDRTLITVGGSYFEVTEAEGDFGIAEFFDDEYKQVDFIKDMITKFRLVLAPDKNNQRNFIVETWTDYIASGDLYDWTDKVDHNKDFTIEPIFFSQTDRLRFEDKLDGDWINSLNSDKFKETFGTLIFDSGNDLLIGEQKIETGFASTPVTQIRGGADSNFLIPLVHAHETEDVDGDTVLKHEPIKPVTRLLFYNGLKTQAKDSAWPSNENRWFFLNDSLVPTAQLQFPMVSFWQDFDDVTGPGPDTINLNWQIENGYANPYASFNYTNGIGMFDRFWAEYISGIYNKFARKVTCYVILETTDLLKLSFDDVIFIDGTYYRPNKITDAIVGQRSVAKVELIKLQNYQLQATPEALESIGTDAQLEGDIDNGVTEGSEQIDDGGDQPVDGGGGPVDGGATTTTRIYELEFCSNPSVAGPDYTASYTSENPLAIGQVVMLEGFNSCWTILRESALDVAPNDATISQLFDDCETCNA